MAALSSFPFLMLDLTNMTKSLWLSLFGGFLLTTTVMAQEAALTAFDSDRISTTGPDGSADFYGSGNDDPFASYGITSFLFTPGDFGVGPITDVSSAILSLTFNNRGFSDGTEFEVFFTTDDLAPDYSGLTFDATGPFDPSGINSTQFTFAPISLGVQSLGFDITDGTLGGTAFDYELDFSLVEAALIGEINASSEFSLLVAAVNNADDITFSGVGNTFDPGDPVLTIQTTVVPEPGSMLVLSVAGIGAMITRRRRRSVA